MSQIKRLMLTCVTGVLVASCSNTDWDHLIVPDASSVEATLNTKGLSYESDALLTQVGNLELPSTVRPCCAFGNDQSVEVGVVPVPFFQLPNIVEYSEIGPHIYNAGQFTTRINEKTGSLQSEGNGMLYTRKGGFIDLAHVRDTADNTVGLFYKIYPYLGEEFTIELTPELGKREIHFSSFDVSLLTAKQQKELAIELATFYAFKMAEGHEISQWHGYESFPLFPEKVSAYSLEDLYSNMLGAKLSAKLLTDDLANSFNSYNQNMSALLDATLEYLEPLDKEETALAFEAVDGLWWDSKQPIPEKYMVLKRNYNLTTTQTPALIDYATLPEDKQALIEDFIANTKEAQSQDVRSNDNVPNAVNDELNNALNLRNPQILALDDQSNGVTFSKISMMTMAINKQYMDTFKHIPTSLYKNNILNVSDYNEIAKYDQIFDKEEYAIWSRVK